MQGQGAHPRTTGTGPAVVHKLTIWERPVMESTSERTSSSFRAVMTDEVTSCDFHNLKQGSLTLQQYFECIIKLRARGPEVAEQSIINAC